MAATAPLRKAILSFGLGPYASGAPPGITNIQETIKDEINRARELGFDQEAIFINPKTETETLNRIEAELKKRQWHGIMIGGGLRLAAEHTVLFEKIVQVSVRETKGDAKLMFSSRPDQIVDVLIRNFPEMSTSI